MRTLTHNLGFPRIGAQRELKKHSKLTGKDKTMSINCWPQRVQSVPVTGCYSKGRNRSDPGRRFFTVRPHTRHDHVTRAIPHRFGNTGDKISPDLYFAMARGTADQPAMEMTKWFNTNYHYIVPEFDDTTQFRLASDRLFQEIEDAKALGITAKLS